jgi:hypothetical protein
VPNFVLFLVPLYTVMIGITVNMVLIYMAVRSQEAASEHCRIRPIEPEQVYIDEELYVTCIEVTDNPTCMTTACRIQCCFNRKGRDLQTQQKVIRAVFWQCVCYLGAFYTAWPIIISAQFEAEKDTSAYIYWCIAFSLAPSQGFWNFLVYARPRYLKFWRRSKPLRKTMRHAGIVDESVPQAQLHAVTQDNALPTCFIADATANEYE